MRIGFFISDFPRVTETFILTQLDGLLDRGHEVVVFAPPCPEDQVNHDALERHSPIWHRTRMLAHTRLHRTFNGVRLIAKHGLRNPRLVTRSLDVRRFGRYALSFSLLNSVTSMIEAPAVDLVHCHFGPTGVIAALLKDLGVLGTPMVVTFYGHDVIRYPRTHGADVYKHLFQEADLLLALDPVMQDRLEDLGAPPEKLRIQPLSVDCARFSPPPNRTDQPPLELISVGRFVEKKGFEHALRAVALALASGADIRYRIAGDGPLRGRLEQVARELDIESDVHFLGQVSHEEVRDLMLSSHVLLAPSVQAGDGDEEGTPTVIIEAMACGMPIIATRHAGIGSLVEDGVNGWLVSERDVESLAECIARSTNPEVAITAGDSARKIAVDKFSSTIVLDRLESMYRELLRS